MATVPIRINIPGYIRHMLDHGDTFDELAKVMQMRVSEGEPMTGEELKAWYEAHKDENIYSS